MSVDLRIELLRKDDLGSALELVNWAIEHTVANFATRPESLESWLQAWRATSRFHPWLVARTRDSVIGFARAMPHHASCAYRWSAELSVYVHPAWHGRNVATALYRELIALLEAQGYTTLLALITDGNEASEKLHERFGFTRSGTLHRVGWKFDRWLGVGYWERCLQHDTGAPHLVLPVLDVLAISPTLGATRAEATPSVGRSCSD